MADKRQRFIDAFASIRDELVADFTKHNMPQDAQEWYRRVCDQTSGSERG